jgi:ubiquinone/menaquinone biosynthesis C-methylase UbiE
MSEETIDVVTGYDLWSSEYDAFDNPLVALASHAIGRRAASFAGQRVLELGCGTGRNADCVLDAGATSYVGVDASGGMLARARARSLDTRAAWLHAPIEALEPGYGPFDVVLASLVLEHLASLDGAFRAARAVAAEGAVLRAFELHPAHHARGKRAHFRAGDRELALPSHPHDEAEIVAALGRTRWTLEASTSWYPTPAAIAASAKLARYTGLPVLIEVAAVAV